MKTQNQKKLTGMGLWDESYNRNFGILEAKANSEKPVIGSEQSKYLTFYPTLCEPFKDGCENLRFYSVTHPKVCKDPTKPIRIEKFEIGYNRVKVVYHDPPLTREELKTLDELFPNI